MVDDVTKAEQERSHGKVMSGIGKLGGGQFFSYYERIISLINSLLGINSL